MSNWSVLVHHAATMHQKAREEAYSAMLPTNATPLNERAIQDAIAEHQAEIRRCFAPQPGSGRTAPSAWLPRLINLWRRANTPSPHQGAVPRAEESA